MGAHKRRQTGSVVATERIIADVGASSDCHRVEHGHSDAPASVASRSVISRIEAKRKMLKRYFTGVPCRNAHVSERYVTDAHCCACEQNKPEKREYFRTRYTTDKDFRKRQTVLIAAWKQKTGWIDPKMKERNLRFKAKKDAKTAANMLTELLGVPHVVIEAVDDAGKKTFQPMPATA